MIRKFFFSFIFLAAAYPAFTQKNVTPVSKSDLLDLPLPAGSKLDKRLLSVSTATFMLKSEAKLNETEVIKVEVLVLPATSFKEFTIDTLINRLKVKNWSVQTSQTPHYYLAANKSAFVIFYYEKNKSDVSLYIASCSQLNMPVDSNKPSSGTVTKPGNATPSPQSATNTVLPENLLGIWLKSGTVNYNFYNQPVTLNSGYSIDQYEFTNKGTYTFHSKSVLYTDDKILLVREKGTYKVNGNQLTITPSSCVIEEWSKKGNTDVFNKLIKTHTRTKETTVYSFTHHYFAGIQEWNFVLQAQQPTLRDGPFSSNDTFPNAWYFRRPSSSNNPIDIPGKVSSL